MIQPKPIRGVRGLGLALGTAFGLALGTVFALAAGGCAGIKEIWQAPAVRLDHVVVRSIGLSGGTLDLVVDVVNPNRFTLRGTTLRLGFDVEDDHVGDLTYDDDFTIAEGDTTRLTLPLTFQWSGVAGAVRTALSYGEIPYRVSGELALDTPIGARSVPFSQTGRVPLIRPGAPASP